MTFTQMNLDAAVAKAIVACGYKTPTPVQQRAIPEILDGKDVVACAQTGTGKTAAFVLPALSRLNSKQNVRKPRVLVLTPTRELASQITTAASQYGKFLRFRMASLVGGMSYRHQIRDLSRSVDMIIATPGRLLDHMENRRVDLSEIEMLVLDEADRMLDMGFVDDVLAIASATPKSRQTLLFSATVDNRLNGVIKKILKSPLHIDLSKEKISPSQITQELYYSDNPHHKSRLLQHFLTNTNIFKAIIFSATKIGADRLAHELCDQGFLAAPLHGDLKQSLRNRTIEQLRRGKIQFLVATDVAARGIDIADMTHVINYDLPRFCEDYVHRIGRTGRAGKSGVAISFALPSDRKHVTRIEHYIGARFKPLTIPGLEPDVKKTHEDSPPRRKKPHKSKSFSGKHSKNRFSKESAPFKKEPKKEKSFQNRNEKRAAFDEDSFETRKRPKYRDQFSSEKPKKKTFERSPFKKEASAKGKFKDSFKNEEGRNKKKPSFYDKSKKFERFSGGKRKVKNT